MTHKCFGRTYESNSCPESHQSNTKFDCRLTQREPETSKESWNAVDSSIAEEIRKSPAASWDYGVGELITSTDKYTKASSLFSMHIHKADIDLVLREIQYGLYDRPELKTWHKGRVLLIGDAAHPTSPVSILMPKSFSPR